MQQAIIQGGIDFLWILIPMFAVMLGLYFGLGLAIDRLNRRNPDRRIQPGRRGEKRMRVEIRASVVSVFVTSFCLSAGLFAQAQGWTMAPLELNLWSGLLLFGLCMVLFDTWFYWMHRLMHTRFMYRWHLWHHRSVAPTVWSTFSDDPLDTFVMQGFYIIAPFVIPFPPAILVAHRLLDHVNGTIGHCGFEYFASKLSRWPSLMLCAAYHDQHHSGFRYNYANYFSFWDRLFGTVHPEYDSKVKELETIATGVATTREAK